MAVRKGLTKIEIWVKMSIHAKKAYRYLNKFL